MKSTVPFLANVVVAMHEMNLGGKPMPSQIVKLAQKELATYKATQQPPKPTAAQQKLADVMDRHLRGEAKNAQARLLATKNAPKEPRGATKSYFSPFFG